MPKVKVQQTVRNTYANLPKEILEHLKLNKGDYLEFRIRDDGSVIIYKKEFEHE